MPATKVRKKAKSVKYAIVDIETTGLKPQRDRITEIAIVLFDGENILQTYSSLLKPGVYLPAGISEMTGITNEMLENAPPFYEEARHIVELTEGCIFVGHNVRFDYSFVAEEFKRLGYSFQRKKLCTLHLMRKYFPGLPSYSLGNLIRHFNIAVEQRHRALDDALATTELLKRILALENTSPQTLLRQNNRSSLLPGHWDEDFLNSIPKACGIYYMQDAQGDVVYVGKSINIRKRILQHFQAKTTKAARMQRMVHSLHWEITGNELMALLLESREIKRLSPPLNRAQRRKTYAKAIHLYENAQGYLCLQIVQQEIREEDALERENLHVEKILADRTGIIAEFARSSDARRFLQRVLDEHELCSRLCHLEKGTGPCFRYQLKKCLGACCQKEPPESYNKRVLASLEQLHLAARDPFLLIEKGREENEHCLILVRQNYPVGYAYLHQDEMDAAMHDPENFLSPLPLHPENRRILFWYLDKYAQTEVVWV